MDLNESFRFHKENYDYNKILDDNDTWLRSQLFYLACFVSYYTGMAFLIKIALSKYFDKRSFENTDIASIIFSQNHNLVNQELESFDMNYPTYDLSFTKLEHIPNQEVLVVPSLVLFLCALANGKLYLDTIKKYKDDQILQKNKFKLFKLTGYALLFEYLTKDLKVLIKFNDHIFNSLLLLDFCKENDIKTVYVQHAPVSPSFPPLSHDLNVLFSEDSRRKYRVLEEPKAVFEFLDIRLLISEQYKVRRKGGEGNVLIAVNIWDDMDKLKDLLIALHSDYQIFLRPHPRDQRSFKSFESLAKVTSGTSIWEDMNQCEMVLCNESAVPLEAIYYGRKFYKIPLLSESRDSYGFLEKGLLTEEFNNIPSLKRALAEKRICFNKDKLEYYIGDVEHSTEAAQALKRQIEQLKEESI